MELMKVDCALSNRSIAINNKSSSFFIRLKRTKGPHCWKFETKMRFHPVLDVHKKSPRSFGPVIWLLLVDLGFLLSEVFHHRIANAHAAETTIMKEVLHGHFAGEIAEEAHAVVGTIIGCGIA